MSRMLPHRIATGAREGQCRDCGTYDARHAPDTCQRCAVERYGDVGHQVVADPQTRLERYTDETWRQVALGIFTGSIRSDRFYIFVGHNDGGPLTLPPDDGLGPQAWSMTSARAAQATAEFLLEHRYPQAWVVTTVGCWNAARPREGAEA